MKFLLRQIQDVLRRGSIELDNGQVGERLRTYLETIFALETMRYATDGATLEFANTYATSNPMSSDHTKDIHKQQFYLEIGGQDIFTDNLSTRAIIHLPLDGGKVGLFVIGRNSGGHLVIQDHRSVPADHWETIRKFSLTSLAILTWAIKNVPEELLEESKLSVAPMRGGSRDYSSPEKLSYVKIRGLKRESDGSYSAEDAAGVRYHHVRGHIRHLKDDKTTSVREHWRGDKSLGVVHQLYVTRKTGPVGTI